MVKLAISELTTLRWSFEQDVLSYAAMGFGGIGIWRPKLDEYGLEKCAELLQEHRLDVSSLSWAGGFTGSDGRGFNDAVEDGIEAVETAAALGAATLIVLSGGRNNHIQGHALRVLRAGLQAIGDAAQSLGVSLALEPMHPGCGHEWSFVHDIRSTLDVIISLDRPHIGLVLDTYHLGMDQEVLDWLPEIIPALRLVQLGDARHSPLGEQNRCLLGDGCVPLPQILNTLAAAGYEGFLEVELLGQDVEPLPYEDVLQHTRHYLDAALSGVSIE